MEIVNVPAVVESSIIDRAPSEDLTDRITREFGSLKAAYWPRGMFFPSRSYRDFLLQFQHYARPGGKCLDLGCGPGAAYKPYIEMHGLEWHGADIIESVDPPEPAYTQVTDTRLNFGSGFFDIICMYNVIEHLRDPEQMFREIGRCMKPGGILCGTCAFWEREHDSYFHFSHRGLTEILHRHGFEIIYLQSAGFSGTILSAQRFFGGNGKIRNDSRSMRVLSTLMGTLNWIPYITISVLEALRKTVFRKWYDPARDAAGFCFYARKM